MEPVGTAGPAFTPGTPATAAPAATPVLSAGAVVDVRVVRALTAGRFLVALGNTEFTASSEADLKPGSQVRLSVASASPDGVVLRLAEPVTTAISAAPQRQAALRLPATPAAAAVLAAFEEAGAPLDPPRLQAAVRAASLPDAPKLTAQAHALLARAALPATPALVGVALRAAEQRLPDLAATVRDSAQPIELPDAQDGAPAIRRTLALAGVYPAEPQEESTASQPPGRPTALPTRPTAVTSAPAQRTNSPPPPPAEPPPSAAPASPAAKAGVESPQVPDAAPMRVPPRALPGALPSAAVPQRTGGSSPLPIATTGDPPGTTRTVNRPENTAPGAPLPEAAPRLVPARTAAPEAPGPGSPQRTGGLPTPETTSPPRQGIPTSIAGAASPAPTQRSGSPPTADATPPRQDAPARTPTPEAASAGSPQRTSNPPTADALPPPRQGVPARIPTTDATPPARQGVPARTATTETASTGDEREPAAPGNRPAATATTVSTTVPARSSLMQQIVRLIAAEPQPSSRAGAPPAVTTTPAQAAVSAQSAAPVLPTPVAPPITVQTQAPAPPVEHGTTSNQPAPATPQEEAAAPSVREHLAEQVFKPKDLADYDRVVPLPLSTAQVTTPARLAVATRSTGGGAQATFVRVDAELTRLGPVSVRLSGVDSGGPLAITLIARPGPGAILAEELPALVEDLRALGIDAAVRVVADG